MARQVLSDAVGRGVGAVGGSEGVVDVELGERRQPGQCRVVLGLAGLEAAVLQHQHLARLQGLGQRLDLVPDDRGRLRHLSLEQLAEALRDRLHGQTQVHPLRAAPGATRARSTPPARAAARWSGAKP